jgi:hypothetical protein
MREVDAMDHSPAASLLWLCSILNADERTVQKGVELLGDRDEACLELAQTANFHRVGGYLQSALRHFPRALVPDAFLSYVDFIAERNALRNGLLKRQIVEIGLCLNKRGIVPMLLKGGAFLITDTAEPPGGRMPLDLDFMVEPDCFDKAIEALAAIGYQVVEHTNGDITHAHGLFHPERPAPIDLHRTLGRQWRLVTVQDAWARAERLEFPEARMLVPSPTHRLFHAIFHSELQHRRYILGQISVQLLIDIARILETYGSAVDLDELIHTFVKGRSVHVYSAALYATYRLLGAGELDAIPNQARPRRHHARCLAQLRFPVVRRMIETAGIVSHPASRYHVGYKFHCEDTVWRLALMRSAYPFMQAIHYKWRVADKIVQTWKDLSVQLQP